MLSACLAAQVLAQGNSNGNANENGKENANENSNKNKDPEEFTFTVEATFKGKKIPQNEIKLAKIPPGKEANPGKKLGLQKKQDRELGSGLTARGTTKNPTSGSANWCGSVKHTTTTKQIKLIHAYFQHPTCTKRAGQTYPQATAQWAGIDGDTWSGALLQSGTVCKIDNSTGVVRYVSHFMLHFHHPVADISSQGRGMVAMAPKRRLHHQLPSRRPW